MGNMRFDRRKLLEIQMLALQYHRELISYPEAKDMEERGGFLIQGNHYAASHKMFFGLNPHEPEDGEFYVNLLQGKNGPWDAKCGDEEWKLPFWRNCTFFFNNDSDLRKWITDATSTFVCPWITEDATELKNHRLWKRNGVLKAYSKAIVLKMIEHHDAPRVIILAGKECRELFWEFLEVGDEFKYEMPPEEGKRRYGNHIYQWGKAIGSQIYQVPHFARASNTEALQDCARWLSDELQPFQPKTTLVPAKPPVDKAKIAPPLNRVTGLATKSEDDNLITMIREAVQKVFHSKAIVTKNTSANATTFKGCYIGQGNKRYFCGVYFVTPYQHTFHEKYKPDAIHFEPVPPKGETSARSIRNTEDNTIFDMNRVQQPSPPFQLYSDNGYVHYMYKLDNTFFSLGEAQQQLDKVAAFVEKAYESFEQMQL